MTDAATIFSALAHHLQERGGQLTGVDGVFQFIVTGEGGGDYHLTAAKGAASIHPGRAGSPDVTVTVAAQDFALLVKGELNPMSAFFSGRLRVSGDMGRAMQLQSILSQSQHRTG
ncbi:MAG TPA: sterol-binding protein [Clostridiales bacterium UBA8153]|nr:sterol-binding protein [Clostridiales bacterium UBA8153]